MPTVVGVRLRFSKTLWFDPAGTAPEEGGLVVVETERGTDIGRVVQPPHEVEQSALPAALKPVVRLANDDDLARADELAVKEHEAMSVFRALVEKHKLDMKPVDVEYLFGGDKVVFYFSAEERIDFRDLVRELASEFHARIDMRQVGVRDEARAVGGIGHCGQVLCCVRFGGEFQPVSIRMAKEQDLPLNPLKISGLCGRLMCCLRYEYDAYKDFKGRAPKRGAIIDTPAGAAKVAELNTPRETVRMRLEDGTSVTVPLSEMQCAKGTGCPCSVSQETLDALNAGPAFAAPLEPVAAPAAPSEPAGDSGRKRRRRKPGGGSQEGSADSEAAAPKQAPKQGGQKQGQRQGQRQGQKQQGQKEASKASGEVPTGGETTGEPGRSTRRRRRRRSGGSGGGQTAG